MTRTRLLRPTFVAAILAGSFLLFLVQPMVARMALPRLGGAPAVWNSAMLVYQALLLGGYAYAHLLGRVPVRSQAATHLAVLLVAALWLPIGLARMELPADAQPALWVPWLLAVSIGPLFFAISAQAPLLQRWFAQASGGQDPYPLYAASNLGSFAGLIAYPLLAEPLLSLHGQSRLWSAGYAVVVVLVALAALRLPRAAASDEPAATSPRPGTAQVARWIALAFAPSGLMLATSTFITTDIVAMPLLWVIPLGLYLLSFSVAFATNRALPDLLTRVAPITILLFGGVLMAGASEHAYLNAVLALLLLFMAAVALHTQLFRERPAPDRLTGFYFAMSVGGALGGVFAGLIAPVVFDWTWEFPILVLVAGALVPQAPLFAAVARLWMGSAQRRRILTLAVALAVLLIFLSLASSAPDPSLEPTHGIAFLAFAALALLVIGQRAAFLVALLGALVIFGGWQSLGLSLQGNARTRSYFGVYTVRGDGKERQLAHGTTVHGMELIGSPARERTPTTYYALGSGVSQAMLLAPALYGAQARIGVVGLGAGTLACYARPGERWRIFEIDPAIVHLARDTGQFRFLRDCLPQPDIVIGDARLRLAAEPAASFDLLALDAFSSDAVPMHLMTREAFATYARVLAPGGLLLVHISNRYLALEPVVAAAADAGGWHARLLHFSPGLDQPEASASEWIALSRDPATLARLIAGDAQWRPLRREPGFAGWTDDHASILPVLKAFRPTPPR